jgi:hypothetical protein
MPGRLTAEGVFIYRRWWDIQLVRDPTAMTLRDFMATVVVGVSLWALILAAAWGVGELMRAAMGAAL